MVILHLFGTHASNALPIFERPGVWISCEDPADHEELVELEEAGVPAHQRLHIVGVELLRTLRTLQVCSPLLHLDPNIEKY